MAALTEGTFEVGNPLVLRGQFAEPYPASASVFVRGPQDTDAQERSASVDPQGLATATITLDAAGDWHYRFVSSGEQFEGRFTVDEDTTRTPAVTEQTDVRSLVPRVRRALGDAGTGLDDDEVVAVTADAIAAVIFYTGGSCAFGYELLVSARDAYYLAPVAWATDVELTLEAQTVVAAQAALSQLFTQLSDVQATKVAETLRDEGQEWSYQLSAQVITKQIDALTRMRDDALTKLAAQEPMYDRYVTYLAECDQSLIALIDWRFVPDRALG